MSDANNPPSGGSSIKTPPFEPGTTNALDSLAVTAKRIVDLAEKFAALALEEIEAGKKQKAKGK